MYEVEKGIPLPQHRSAGNGRNQILLRSLEVGDSFFIPNGNMMGSATHQFREIAKKLEIKITTRTVEGGVRIWRIE